ncbi:MAG: ArsR family transcriptional regulator [Candidatus Dojkabacteria bacterium]|nr:ArsR family transcriptional regulator [Candidatus Dojkabacteria bacterium]MDQ7020523.1 ArsR family transcriptional regulator [Candidatus Dojkabacteria bacterium]
MNKEWEFIHKVHKLVYELDRTADEILRSRLNLTYSQFLILSMLKDKCLKYANEIALALGVSQPAVSRQIEL